VDDGDVTDATIVGAFGEVVWLAAVVDADVESAADVIVAD
jgi:hypothetical protein